MSGRCATSFEGRLSGRSRGRENCASAKVSSTSSRRIAPGERGQEIALLREAALQGRQSLARLGERGLLRENVGSGDGAVSELPLQQRQPLFFERDDAPRRGDLAAQRRLFDRRLRDIRRERQMRRLFLIDLLVAYRVERFDVAPIRAPNVQRVVDLHLLGEEGIGASA